MFRFVAVVLASVALLTLTGCNGFSISHRPGRDRGGDDRPVAVHEPGPPPHAPAHGYRAKHASGRELRYDEGLGVYVVIGATDIYFDDDWFIRIRDGAWEFSASFDGPWEIRTADAVPVELRTKKQKNVAKQKPGKGRGHSPAKGAW